MALDMTNELLELQPGHERAAGNKMYYEGEIKNLPPHLEGNLRGDDGSPSLQDTVSMIKCCFFFKLNFGCHVF